MDATFLQMLEDLHEANQYLKIVETIEALPPEEQDAEVIGQLARAYCNLAQYDHALELLFSAPQPDSFAWNFRVGFAYYFNHKPLQALPYFEQAFAHHPAPDIADFIALCQISGFPNKTLACIRATKSDAGNQLTHKIPENEPKEQSILELSSHIAYLPRDFAAVQAHIEQSFGSITATLTFHTSRAMEIRLCVCAPTRERNYYTISTLGMGALPMHLPKEQETQIPARMELIMTLPADWRFDLNYEQWAWPLRWLLITAYLPFDEDTWLSYGHTLSSSADNTPFDPTTKQSSILVVDLQDQPESAAQCTLPDGETVRFLQALSLYPEELEYKTQYGAAALLKQMSNTGHVVRPYRLNTCTSDLLFPRVNPSPYLC